MKSNHNLSDQDAKICWEIIKENITDHGLVQVLSGKKVIVTRDMAIDTFDRLEEGEIHVDKIIKEDRVASTNISIGQDRIKSDNTNSISPEFHFNIQIVLPENSTPETYDSIFKSISIHLLGRKES